MPRQRLAPIALPTTLLQYSAAATATSITRNIRVQLGKEATPSDVAAVFACDDKLRSGGTMSTRFSAQDPTTWPPGCKLVAVVTGAEVAHVPEVAWAAGVVVERVAGSTAVNVLISGEGTQKTADIAAPTTVGDWIAGSLEEIGGPLQVGWDRNAGPGDQAELYLSDDPTLNTGSGVPPGAKYHKTIAGGGQPVEIPEGLLATRIVVRRVAGTDPRFVLVTGRGSVDAGLVSDGDVSLQGAAVQLGGTTIGLEANQNISISSIDGGNLLLAAILLVLSGSLRFTPQNVGTTDVDGTIGGLDAASTVDACTVFRVNQTGAGRTLTLPAPAVVNRTALAVVMNVGTQSFAMYGKTVTPADASASAALLALWTGAAWVTLA